MGRFGFVRPAHCDLGHHVCMIELYTQMGREMDDRVRRVLTHHGIEWDADDNIEQLDDLLEQIYKAGHSDGWHDGFSYVDDPEMDVYYEF